LVDLPVGGSVTFTITADIASGFLGTLINTASIIPPDTLNDVDTSNNTASDATEVSAMVLSVTRQQVGEFELLMNEGQTRPGALVGFAYSFEKGAFELPHLGITLGIIPIYSNVGVGINNTIIGLSPDLEELDADKVYFQSFEIRPNPKVSNIVEVGLDEAAVGEAESSPNTVSIPATQLANLPGHQNPLHNTDVDADGYVAPLDALLVINTLNEFGSRAASEGEGSEDTRYFYDVNGDSSISPLDVLIIINELNGQSSPPAEGEGSAVGSMLSLPPTPMGTLPRRTRDEAAIGAVFPGRPAAEPTPPAEPPRSPQDERQRVLAELKYHQAFEDELVDLLAEDLLASTEHPQAR
jgi:hypothetical protein